MPRFIPSLCVWHRPVSPLRVSVKFLAKPPSTPHKNISMPLAKNMLPAARSLWKASTKYPLPPARAFYVNPETGRHQARITYCLCTDDLKHAIKCLDEALKVYPGRLNK